MHIITQNKHISPSAFIPFCEFGGNISSTIGIKIDNFEEPVCNIFQATILNDQLCYEVDVSRFVNKDNIKQDLKSGFAFIMDYNEDRQVDKITQDELEIAGSIVEYDQGHASIYLNTIGKQ